MPRAKLITTQDEFDDLHELLDRTKANKISISRQVIEHLLADHSELCQHAEWIMLAEHKARLVAAQEAATKPGASRPSGSGKARGGSGAWIREQLLMKTELSDEALAGAAREKFGGKTSAKDVGWNRNKLKKDGLL